MKDSAIQDLLLTASKYFKVDIHTKSRKQEHIEARAIVYSIMRDCLNMTYKDIGKVFNKNHATILHAVNELPYMIKYTKGLGEKRHELLELWGSAYTAYTVIERAEKIKYLQDKIFLLNLEAKLLTKQLNELLNV
tara:strand:+ start:3121 stop:3525 length:405 start_codon:yes stop_codon:yes gene_type:complete